MKKFMIISFVFATLFIVALAIASPPATDLGNGGDNMVVTTGTANIAPTAIAIANNGTENADITATALTKELGAGQNTQLNHATYQAARQRISAKAEEIVIKTPLIVSPALFKAIVIPKFANVVVCSAINWTDVQTHLRI